MENTIRSIILIAYSMSLDEATLTTSSLTLNTNENFFIDNLVISYEQVLLNAAVKIGLDKKESKVFWVQINFQYRLDMMKEMSRNLIL